MSAHPYAPVLFDLDGTIADTYPGIVQAANDMLVQLGFHKVPVDWITPLTGRGVKSLVRGLLAAVGAPDDDTALRERAVGIYSKLYDTSCADGTTVYPGMVELVHKLTAPRVLLTNKPRGFTERILKRIGLVDGFTAIVAGDDPGVKLKPDPWQINEGLNRARVRELDPIFVGDTFADVLAARAAGVPSAIVKWGHGAEEAASMANFVIETPAELEQLLTGERKGR